MPTMKQKPIDSTVANMNKLADKIGNRCTTLFMSILKVMRFRINIKVLDSIYSFRIFDILIAFMSIILAGVIGYLVVKRRKIDVILTRKLSAETNATTLDSTIPETSEEINSAISQSTSQKNDSSINTSLDLPQFCYRMYKNGFLVKRYKKGVVKSRYIQINLKGEFCMHKISRNISKNIASMTPYQKVHLVELKDCFQCGDQPKTFIVEFNDKTLHLSVSSPLDTEYIVNGIKEIAKKKASDPNFLARYERYVDSGIHVTSEEVKHHEEDDGVSIASGTSTVFHSRSPEFKKR